MNKMMPNFYHHLLFKSLANFRFFLSKFYFICIFWLILGFILEIFHFDPQRFVILFSGQLNLFD
jgi:hypothetical protein